MTQPTGSVSGLSTAEAAARLKQYGPNAIPETKTHPFLAFLKFLWGPIPWLLEITVILQLLLGKTAEAIIIALLLLFNAAFSAIQAKRSSDALALLRQHLKLTARVLRDGNWIVLPSDQLAPGDVIHIRMGDLLPADVQLLDGDLLIDQSVLTGEALPVEVSGGGNGYAGAVVKHGEATATVTATGTHTRFGRTAELVRQAHTESNLEKVIFSITRALVILAALLAIGIMVYALLHQTPLLQILPFALILLVAAVPAALPATFAIATALGAQELSHKGVLVTNLTAIEEAAGMDVLCSDKTGTITQNQLGVAQLRPDQTPTEEALLNLAAMACDPSTQDPIDLAILKRAEERKVLPDFSLRTQFLPFDPETKRSEAYFNQNNTLLHVAKGAPHAIAAICQDAPATLDAEVDALAAQGYRVLGVAHGEGQTLQWSGLVSLQDPPRPDSAELIHQLREWGIRIVMITGDGLPTAQAVARQVGLGDRACTAQALTASNTTLSDCDVFAEVLPEHKCAIVQTLQKQGHIVGMTGDGVNDAPALHQAQVGVAVANATDVAKAAASLVLTTPGLENIRTAVEVSRQIYQRMLTYTLNKIIKTILLGLFLSLGLLLTGEMVITPLLVVLLMFANDFATMSIATDRVRASDKPNRWQIPAMVIPSLALALPLLMLVFGIYWFGRDLLHLSVAQQQTLSFITLVFVGQGVIYLMREQGHFWASRPSNWMIVISALVLVIGSLAALLGIFMQAIPLAAAVTAFLGVVGALVLLDFLKVWMFGRLRLR